MLCLIVAAGAGGYVYLEHPEIFTPRLTHTPSPPPAPAERKKISVVNPTETLPAPGTDLDRQKPRPRQTPSGRHVPGQKPDIEKTDTRRVTRAAPVKRPDRPAETARKTERSATFRENRLPPRTRASAEKIQAADDRLKLQAIAWSDDARQRIVVINDQVLREGDAVDGVLVSEIGRDEVTVKDGDRLRKLIFRFQ